MKTVWVGICQAARADIAKKTAHRLYIPLNLLICLSIRLSDLMVRSSTISLSAKPQARAILVGGIGESEVACFRSRIF